ncbi:hypothetical protein A6V39_05475 [Candidatus Mycoplasma haematobovis]|uniref:Uncharacterized protein n=1 Tax=Candidatus Mycoplasma haematobovis TaxID=432608 RepID=A0A1A9QCC7_9MOLU|nr:hypothetical protein [Candidatus Mycoplasma haematobovis]OAL09744.1 hypothetical protein A6V39_05475 [Candidatus Mycoplasma haematobovis]
MEEELEKLCKENPEDCKTERGVKDIVNKESNLIDIFKDRLNGICGISSNINETCRNIVA